jgi:mannose-6-phosphate isomerase-like protein (cupin superfamily)
MRGALSNNGLVLAFALAAVLVQPTAAQDRKVWLGWSPKPAALTPYGDNRPITRLSDVLARHQGQANWSEDVVETDRYDARWIQMAPGGQTRPALYGDDRVVWVVWGGQIRFNIDGQAPFVASKGWIVQAPARTVYSLETVGDEPSLRFEVRPGGKPPSYPVVAGEPPPPNIPGFHYVKVRGPASNPDGGSASYDAKNKPYIDFFKDVVGKRDDQPAVNPLFAGDEDDQALIIRGHGIPTPPDSNKGHFHIGNEEFWFIMEGKIDYLIEGEGLFTANMGDVVLAAPGRWHRASYADGQMDTRLAFNRSPTLLHNFDEHANGRQ